MKYLVVLLLGLLVGGGAATFFLGIPRAKPLPGNPLRAPDPAGDQQGTVIITLDQKFFDALLDSVFSDLGGPALRLGQTAPAANSGAAQTVAFQSRCQNAITLTREMGGVRTAVQFGGGNITAPLAFSGSYDVMGNCMQFKGWAQTNIQLSFDQSRQTVYGQVRVEGVNLDGVMPFANSFVTVFVQNAINQRINPVEVLRGQQLSLVLPLKASNGTLRASVKDVRAEVLEGALRMHITYGFSGQKGDRPQG
jgi:hypothetical protein